MSTIEDRIVQMVFDNHQFEQGISASLDSLDKLNDSLKLKGATDGIDQVGEAAKHLSLGGIADAVDSIAGKFKTMSIVGIAALSNIVNRAVNAGISITKSLTIDPIKAGLQNYETQINAVQTILANTQAEGTKLSDVNAVLADLNEYANKTVYNFSEMTQNIGTFTAAGVKLKPAADAIKGIANLAALSGSNSQQASTAMYQLSQAIAAGKVSLEDWNSVVNAGLGGKTFQTALVNTARASGVAIDSIIKKAGSFRNSLQKGWLTSDILTKTLSQFTGDLSEAQIKAMGFTDKEAQAILKLGKTAVDSATNIKTMSQLTDALKEEVATAWASVFKIIFGNINQATTLFTSVHNVAENALTKPIYDLQKLLQGWADLGGRTVLIDALKTAFKELGDILNPIKSAFREIFPASSSKNLYDLTVTFRDFIERLKIGGQTLDDIKRTFAGVFAVLDLGWDILKAGAKAFLGLFGQAAKGTGSILEITAKIGDFLVAVHNAVEEGGKLNEFFGGLEKILEIPLKLLETLASRLASLFDKIDFSHAAKSLSGVSTQLSPMAKIMAAISSGGDKLNEALNKVLDELSPWVQKVVRYFENLGHQILNALSNLDFSKVLSIINTGLFGGLVLLISKFVKNLRSNNSSSGGLGGIVDSIKEVFEGLTDTLKSMQQTLKAATLLEIAAAIGILTISVVALSKIDSNKLKKSLAAMTVMFAQLFTSMGIFNKVVGSSGFAKMSLVTGAMILLATAIDLLVIAVKQLSGLDWNGLAKGLTGVTVLIGGLVAAVKLMPPGSGMISAGLGMLALAKAIDVLATAVQELSGLDWKQLAKGLSSVAGLLVSLALFSKFSDANKAGALSGAGIVLIATAMKILASAVGDFAKFSWTDIGKGLGAISGGLIGIGIALKLIPPSSVLSAAGVLIVASSLGLIADAVQKMGGMDWGTIGKGLAELAGALGLIAAALYVLPPSSLLSAAAIFTVAASLNLIVNALQNMAGMSWSEIGKSLVELAGALGLIAGAMLLMTDALPGAAALLVVAGSLAILTPILLAFGAMSWDSIIKSLTELAGVFVIIGAAGLVLGPVVPILLGLGAAITLIGIGTLAAGAGVLLFATGLTALSAAGTVATATVVGIVNSLIGLIPQVLTGLGQGIIAFAEVISTAGPQFTKAITVVLTAIIAAIVKVTPLIINALLTLMLDMLNALARYVPQMVSAGLRLLTGILNGIANNVGKMVTAATNVVVAFINGVSNNLPRVIKAGTNLIINFINSLAAAIRQNSSALGQAGANLGTAIIEGMVKGLASGVSTVASEAESVAKSAINAARGVLHINSPSKVFIAIGQSVNEGFVKGLKSGNRKDVDAAFNDLKKQLDDLAKNSKASRSERTKAAAASKDLTKNYTDEKNKLDKLSDSYSSLTTRINNANTALADAKKTLSDYQTQITQTYSTATAPTADESVSDYITGLQTQLEQTKEYANTLQRLRNLGLNDEAFKQLSDAGIADLPFAQNLLAGGKAAIDQINSLEKQLNTAGASFGKEAATDLYQAAVNSAQGLVDGLKKQQKAIQNQMDAIADAMVKEIKKKLGIKSPSRVFAEIGDFSAQGLTSGFDAAASAVEQSAANMGQTAITSLSKSLSGMSDLVSGGMDLKPTITPVLDLSSVKKDSSQIAGLISAKPISIDDAYSKALYVSAGHMSNLPPDISQTPQRPSAPITYIQNNNSPKALSSADIYRQTKNQLSKLREVVSPNAQSS